MVPVARSLHKHGVPVDVANFAISPPLTSRAIRDFRRVPRPDLDRAGFVEHLRQFIHEGGHDMLIPTDDQALTAMMEHYDDFKTMLHIACPLPHITRLILNKALTMDVAQKYGVRIPQTHVISNSAQLSELVGNFLFPWILKPAEKETREEEVKSYSFAAADEVAKKFPAARDFAPPMLLQEYCAGVGVGIEMLMHDGNCLAAFQHRRLKELPYTGGVSVTAIAEHPEPTLVESSLALLRALQWEGVAMVEFKVNPANGEAVLMEVNGRYWGTISLPIAAGIDFPWYHWQVVHGEQPTIPDTYKAGIKWRWTVGCLLRAHSLLAKSRNSVPARKELWRTVLDIPKDFSPRVFDATSRFSDPLPSIMEFFDAVNYVVKSKFGALRSQRARN